MIRGGQGKHLSRRELEELKKKRDEEETAEVFGEFVAAFDDNPTPRSSKTWVRAGTFDAGSRTEDGKDRGKLYKPQMKKEPEVKKELEPIFGTDDKGERPGKKKKEEKKKSNLELFKEELQKIQEERQERFKLKSTLGSISTVADFPSAKERAVKAEPVAEPGSRLGMSLALDAPVASAGSFDTGDPTTTNLYLGNLHPKVSEQQLVEVFGKYGPLASVKIMWPRTDEERNRGKNCGFVAFMTRKDAERALKAVSGTELMGFEMKLGWGKAVPKPIHPVYVPPQLLELTMPPPPSGLPFNAQPSSKDKDWLTEIGFKGEIPTDPDIKEEFEKVLERCVVKVVIPTERQLLHLIHRTVEFVVREGPMFEAMIMNKELNNPAFRFLFDNKSPAHVYYRWKLFSILHGESPKEWSTKEFRMFIGGSVWRPPPLNPFAQGMPEDLIEEEEETSEKDSGDETDRKSPDQEKKERKSDAGKPFKRGSLSNSQRDRFEDMLRSLTPDRKSISEAMVFCIEHAEAAMEICDCISESLSILETPLSKKIARLFLVSDILHNCTAKVSNASYYRKGFQEQLETIFKSFHEKYESLESRIKAEAFKARVMRVFRAWEDWALYPTEVLIQLQNTFFGFTAETKSGIGDLWSKKMGVDIDGEPMADPDIDGVPLDGDIDGIPIDDIDSASMRRNNGICMDDDDDEEIDGVPLASSSSSAVTTTAAAAASKPSGPLPGFKPSKWETVDPDAVADQAMTTSKWDLLEQDEVAAVDDPQPKKVGLVAYDDDIDGMPMEDDFEDSKSNSPHLPDSFCDPILDEERRAKLRELEIKVVEYSDALESGQKPLKPGMTLEEQVQHYRRKLERKVEREVTRKGSTSDRRRRHSSSDDERDYGRIESSARKKHRTRSRSPKSRSPHHYSSRHRSRSRSPVARYAPSSSSSLSSSSTSRHHKRKSRH